MLRVVVAVALSMALLTVSLPALETARRDHSAQRVTGELDGLTAAIEDVHAREGAVPDGTAGARRVVTLRLPARTWTDAGVEYVAVGGRLDRSPPGEGDEVDLSWQVTGRQPRERRIHGVAVEARTDAGGDGPLVLREPGTHRLAITLVERGNRTVVVVRRLAASQGR